MSEHGHGAQEMQGTGRVKYRCRVDGRLCNEISDLTPYNTLQHL